MPYYFFDTSAIVKRYVQEKGSTWVRGICEQRDPGTDRRQHVIFIGELAWIEVAAAITKRVKRTRDLNQEEGYKAYDLFSKHARDEYQVVPWTGILIGSAVAMVQNHALRAYDAVQLALALHANNALKESDLFLTFVTSDKALLQAAQAEGLAAENPQDHT